MNRSFASALGNINETGVDEGEGKAVSALADSIRLDVEEIATGESISTPFASADFADLSITVLSTTAETCAADEKSVITPAVGTTLIPERLCNVGWASSLPLALVILERV